MAKLGYPSTEGILEVLHALWRGERITRQWVEEEFGVGASTANKWLAFIWSRYEPQLDRRTEGKGCSYSWHGDVPAESNRPLVTALAIEFGSTSLAAFAGTKIHSALRSLGEPVRAKVPQEFLDRLSRVSQVFCRRSAVKPSARHSTVLDKLMTALEERAVCRLRYERMDGTVGDYEVEPWRLIEYRGGLYLFAGKLPLRVERLFDVNGIERAQVEHDKNFVPPAVQDIDVDRLFQHSVGIFMHKGAPVDVVLHVTAKTMPRLKRRPWHSSQRVRELPGGKFEVRLFVKPCPELVSMILAYMPDIVVREPEKLAQTILVRAQGYVDMAGS